MSWFQLFSVQGVSFSCLIEGEAYAYDHHKYIAGKWRPKNSTS